MTVALKEFNACIDTIYMMDPEQLRSVNAVLRERFAITNAVKKAEFRVGQRVSFTTKNRGSFTGTIESKGPKNVKVKTYAGTWTVSPSLLRDASEGVAL